MSGGSFGIGRPAPSPSDVAVLDLGLQEYERSLSLGTLGAGVWLIVLLVLPFFVADLSSVAAPPAVVFSLGVVGALVSFFFSFIILYAVFAAATAWTRGDQTLAQIPPAFYRDDGGPTPLSVVRVAYGAVGLGIAAVFAMVGAGVSSSDIAGYQTVLVIASVLMLAEFAAAVTLLLQGFANCAHVLRARPGSDPRRIARLEAMLQGTAWLPVVPAAVLVAGAATNYIGWQVALVGIVGVGGPAVALAVLWEARAMVTGWRRGLRAPPTGGAGVASSILSQDQSPLP